MTDFRKPVIKGLTAVLLFFVMTPGLSASNLTLNPPNYDEAVKDYKERKYSQALALFKKMHETGQCNDMVHYYMALCYQSLSQIASAKQEYANVTRSKSPVLRNNAVRALASLSIWSQHRLYEGNGNVFSRYSKAPTRVASSKPREIVFDIPAPSGGGC